MTRSKKIEALADSVYPKMHPSWDGEQRTAYIDGLLAGIRLRNEELLAMEFDEDLATIESVIRDDKMSRLNKLDVFVEGARWQYEKFMKLLKGDGE
jgi:hypothetical protein